MIAKPRNYYWSILAVALALWLSVCPASTQATDSYKLAELRQEIAGLLAHPALHGAEVGASVLSIPEGQQLYSLNSRQPVTPASTMKLLVTASALRLLGPNFVYGTSLWTPTPPTEAGAIAGDLIIAGTADPTAQTNLYSQLSQQLSARSIAAVKGRVIGAGAALASEHDEGLQAAQGLQQALISRGISVAGEAIAGAMPPGVHLLYRKDSISLRDYIRAVNLYSDNRRGQLLATSLTTIFGNPEDANHSFIAQLWQNYDVDISNLQLVEGSGLSHHNKLTPALLTGLLVQIAQDQAELGALLDSLPLAGVRGTLRRRMCETDAEGRVYAKTGTLKRVSCLAGYICVDGSPRLAFALMMNGYDCSLRKVRKIQDQVAIHMARYASAGLDGSVPAPDCSPIGSQ